MARALLSRANAFAVIDPHGDLADRVERWARISGQLRVVSLDFTRPESLPSWNPLLPMAGVDPGRQVDLLVSVLQRLYSAERASSWAWGVKVEEIVRMALRGSIESEVPVTLADLERFLLDPRYRKEALATAGPEVTNYFLHRFGPQEQMYVSAVVNKLSPFLGSTAVRRFLGGGGEPVDLLDLPDRPVALIVNLARGALGAAADVLGRLLVNTLLLSALRRDRLGPGDPAALRAPRGRGAHLRRDRRRTRGPPRHGAEVPLRPDSRLAGPFALPGAPSPAAPREYGPAVLLPAPLRRGAPPRAGHPRAARERRAGSDPPVRRPLGSPTRSP